MRRGAVCWNTQVPYGFHISFFFLSLEWAIYKVWVLREYRPSSSNQINTLWCLSSCLSVCLPPARCEPPTSFHLQHLLSLSVSSLIFSLSHSLSRLRLNQRLDLSTAPAPLQMTNLRGGGKELWVEKRTMAPSVHNSFIICYIVTFPFRLFLLLKQKHSSVTTHYIEWISEGSDLSLVKRKKNHKWDLVSVSIVSPRQLWVELRANGECSENFLLRKRSYWWHFSREMRSQCLRFSIISNKSQSKWIYILKLFKIEHFKL